MAPKKHYWTIILDLGSNKLFQISQENPISFLERYCFGNLNILEIKKRFRGKDARRNSWRFVWEIRGNLEYEINILQKTWNWQLVHLRFLFSSKGMLCTPQHTCTDSHPCTVSAALLTGPGTRTRAGSDSLLSAVHCRPPPSLNSYGSHFIEARSEASHVSGSMVLIVPAVHALMSDWLFDP